MLAPRFLNNSPPAITLQKGGTMSFSLVAEEPRLNLIESAQAKIRGLKRQGCICIHSVYGMTQVEFEQSITYRKLTSMNPERYFIGPSLCAGKMRGVGLWRRPLTS